MGLLDELNHDGMHARLFNAVHRKRGLRADAMIAATAIVSGARLATNNRDDFAPFAAHGLKLLE